MSTEKKRLLVGKRGVSIRTNTSIEVNTTQNFDLTLAEATAIFVRAKEAEGLRPRTLESYGVHIGYLREYLTSYKGMSDIMVRDLSAEVIREYITYLRSEKQRFSGIAGREHETIGLAVNTINIRLRTLRTMCRFWFAEGMTAVNVMANIKPVVDDSIEEVPGLSDADVDKILASYDVRQFADWRDRVLILLLLDTGLRINEAVSLTIDRIDFRLLTIYVPSQIAKNRRMREVPISREVAKLLEQLYKESQEYFGDMDSIFNNAYGEPFTADAFRRRLNRRKSQLGLSRLSPHMFRHTFCRNYILNGGDLFTLQKIVDHADIKTTRKYVQMDNDHIRHQHNKYSPVRRLFRDK